MLGSDLFDYSQYYIASVPRVQGAMTTEDTSLCRNVDNPGADHSPAPGNSTSSHPDGNQQPPASSAILNIYCVGSQ